MLRFGIVGISATVIYYAIAMAGSTAGLAPVVANLVGYCAGILTSFIGHFYYTFKKRGNHIRHLVRFIVVSVFGYIFSNLIIFVVMDVNQGPFWLATLIVVLVVPAGNWICGRYWAFK